MPIVFASSACLSGSEPMGERLTRFQSAGISRVELGGGLRPDPTRPFSDQIPMGLTVLLHNYFPPPAKDFVLNLASRDSQVRGASVELVERALRLSAELGCEFFSVHGGFVTDAQSFGKHSFIFPMPQSENEAREAMDRFVKVIDELAAFGSDLGVALLVENNVCNQENKGKLLFQKAEEFEELFARCKVPNVGMLLDTGHLNVSAHTYDFDKVEFIDRLESHIRALHVHDNAGIEDTHDAIREDSWVLEVLRRDSFVDSIVVLESKFNHMEDLASAYSTLVREAEKQTE